MANKYIARTTCVYLSLLTNNLSMKKSAKRNAYAIAAKTRKAGAIKNKKDKRKNNKNKQQEYLSEEY